MERATGMADGCLLAFECQCDRAAQALILFGQSPCKQWQSRARMLGEQAIVQAFESRLALLALFAQHTGEAALQVDQTFAVAGESGLRSLRLQTCEQMIDALRVCLQLALLQGQQALLQLLQVPDGCHGIGHQ